MRKFPSEERLPGAGLCFICETNPQREAGAEVFDTGINFNPPGVHPLKGRKLVCDRCVDNMAKTFGYVKGEDLEAFNLRQATAAQELGQLRDRVRSLLTAVDDDLDNVAQPAQLEGVVAARPDVAKETEETDGSS